MTTADVLRAVRARLEDPSRWCKGASHRGDASCLLGALDDLSDGYGAWKPCERAVRAALPKNWQPRGVAAWNDAATTTHADILAIIDRAIASLVTP